MVLQQDHLFHAATPPGSSPHLADLPIPPRYLLRLHVLPLPRRTTLNLGRPTNDPHEPPACVYDDLGESCRPSKGPGIASSQFDNPFRDK
ncbi:hypothetical protein E2C01_016774 [Portunus trituberculatus]|uniref:Uncharacterized protein n=1 Tax=Portunus trituberculatus TaxID=210409 RepID=A0A5B7DRU3_PORTR|nr:hypothetical protein [Portunus trituberculatus]